MKAPILLLVCAISALSSCVTIERTALTRDVTAGEKNLDVFITTLPEREYTEVAYLEAFGSAYHKKKHCYRKLTKKAMEMDADALINVRFYYTNLLFFVYPQVDAIAIKYKD